MGIVGILVDEKIFRNIKNSKTRNEKIYLYNKAAIQHGLTPVYLCLTQIFPSSGKARGYKYSNGKYTYVRLAIPQVIHNRTLPRSKLNSNRLKYLKKTSIVFNSQNRISKLRIHKLLKKRFASHLPMTKKYTKFNLRSMMNDYSSLYIKPQNSSLGRGIIKISHQPNDKWKLQLPNRSLVLNTKLTEKLLDKVVNNKKYMIQETLNLAQYNGSPYDIRVTVQRGINGHWQVTGMFGKVARKGSHVTNVARGGYVKKCTQLFKNIRYPTATSQAVKNLALDIAQYLGGQLHHLADVGLDIGINSLGKPYFIELNCRDQRYGFKKVNMPKTFYRTYENPVLYAKYLLKNRRVKQI